MSPTINPVRLSPPLNPVPTGHVSMSLQGHVCISVKVAQPLPWAADSSS